MHIPFAQVAGCCIKIRGKATYGTRIPCPVAAVHVITNTNFLFQWRTTGAKTSLSVIRWNIYGRLLVGLGKRLYSVGRYTQWTRF